MFEAIRNHAEGKKVVVFLDYDGTLSPIVEDPDRAFISEEVTVRYFFWLMYFMVSTVCNFLMHNCLKSLFLFSCRCGML